MTRWKPNAYTDAPLQHPNLLLGSLHLHFWLFVRPSAWRNYVARIDPALGPDFALIDLSAAPWRTPAIARLLVQLCLVLPTLGAILVGLVLVASGQPLPTVVFGMTFALALGVVAGLPASVVGGVAVGTAVAILGGAAFGVGFALTGNLTTAAAHGIADGLAIGVNGKEPNGAAYLGLIVSSVIYGMAANLDTTQTVYPGNHFPYTVTRRLGGLLAGILVGAVVISAASLSTRLFQILKGNSTDFLVVGTLAGMAGALVGVISGLIRSGRSRLVGFYSVPGIIGFALIIGAIFIYPLADKPTPAFAIAYGIAGSAVFSLVTASVFGLPLVIARRIAGPWAGAIAGSISAGGFWTLVGLASQPDNLAVIWLGVVTTLLGLTVHLWLPLAFFPPLVALNLLLLRLDFGRAPDRPAFLRHHAAFWNEHQRLPWPGLDEHVVLVARRNPAEGRLAIEYLANSRSQRWAARAAQIELDAGALEQCGSVEQIGAAHNALAAGELEGPASALLRSFNRISQDVAAALEQERAYARRLALNAVEERLDGLLRELTRSSERYVLRFRPIAAHWREIVVAHARDLAAEAEQRQEIDSPYVIGVPLSAEQEIFVGRTDISARIEQLLLDRRRPPLLLYGQRRMGKTSLLNNLGRLLPSTVVPLFVDLQGPATQASNEAGLLYYLAKSMGDSAMRQRGLALPELSRATVERDPFIVFDEWLVNVERLVGNGTGLLILDEFEVLDRAIQRGRFDEEGILGMLRHIIQHRPRLKVLLSGSHGLSEFRRWSSYLINAQVVRIGYLSPDEARKLIEQPVKDFELRYTPEASRRVLALTRGHPFLVQLLCNEIVAHKNDQPPGQRRMAEVADVEAAVGPALDSGDMFFADIAHNQLDADGQALLRQIAAAGEGAVVAPAPSPQVADLDHALSQLLRRELVDVCGGGYQVQVELIRRWFTR
ncbi:MAG: ATP-binding protein [Chloroflexales bacterium]|nr:ATP-binding protein [Chloroflexales bacterium]